MDSGASSLQGLIWTRSSGLDQVQGQVHVRSWSRSRAGSRAGPGADLSRAGPGAGPEGRRDGPGSSGHRCESVSSCFDQEK